METIKRETGYFESFDGNKVYYECHGEGEPLVLVYGIACVMSQWRYQLNYFSKRYKVIMMDFRGHHKTPAAGELSINTLAKDLVALLQHLQISKAGFWGHSFGVTVIIRLLELFPQTVSHCVFINGFASQPIKDMLGVSFMDQIYEKIKLANTIAPEIFKILWKFGIDNPISGYLMALSGGFNFKLTKFEDIEMYAHGVANLDINAFFKFFDELMRYNGNSSLENISAPTLIISGENDTITQPRYQREMHEKIPGSTLLFVPLGSHCTHLDFFDYINLKIEKFLETLPK